jgi:hypothetical protein
MSVFFGMSRRHGFTACTARRLSNISASSPRNLQSAPIIDAGPQGNRGGMGLGPFHRMRVLFWSGLVAEELVGDTVRLEPPPIISIRFEDDVVNASRSNDTSRCRVLCHRGGTESCRVPG